MMHSEEGAHWVVGAAGGKSSRKNRPQENWVRLHLSSHLPPHFPSRPALASPSAPLGSTVSPSSTPLLLEIYEGKVDRLCLGNNSIVFQ